MVERRANYTLQDGKVFDTISRTTPTGGRDLTFLQQAAKVVTQRQQPDWILRHTAGRGAQACHRQHRSRQVDPSRRPASPRSQPKKLLPAAGRGPASSRAPSSGTITPTCERGMTMSDCEVG